MDPKYRLRPWCDALGISHPPAPQAWTLGLLARCHLEAGEAVTAEGLFRAALDGLKGVVEEEGDGGGFSERQGQGAGSAVVLFPSPLHPYSRAATLKAYAGLLSQWENREGEGGIAARRADTVRRRSLSAARSFVSFPETHRQMTVKIRVKSSSTTACKEASKTWVPNVKRSSNSRRRVSPVISAACFDSTPS